MDAKSAFLVFVDGALAPDKGRRLAALAESRKGQKKILAGLYHEFDIALRSSCIKESAREGMQPKPCFVFHSSKDFGEPCDSVSEACDNLALDDGWLVLLQDGSAGIVRPEGRLDDEKVVAI